LVLLLAKYHYIIKSRKIKWERYSTEQKRSSSRVAVEKPEANRPTGEATRR
jgi:hypothetical protein